MYRTVFALIAVVSLQNQAIVCNRPDCDTQFACDRPNCDGFQPETPVEIACNSPDCDGFLPLAVVA